MKRLCLALFLLLSLITENCIYAADASIKKVWIEHGVKINNRPAMKVHCNFNVNGMKGRKGNMSIWIKGPSGNWHNVNSQFKSSSGVPYFKWDFTPGYDSSDYSDYWYAPYIDDLRLLPGKNEYNVVVTINDDRGNILAQSGEVSFSGTGGSNAPSHNSGYNNSGNNSNKNIVNSHREELGYGGFVIVDEYAGGYIVRTRYRLCPNCRGAQTCASCYGRGICALCNGQGGIISAGYGNFYPCAMCNQTGRCSLCGGTGRCACTQSPNKYPGYVIGSTSTIAPDGTTTRDNVDYGNYRSSSRSDNNSSSAKKTCPDCGGTRLWRRGKSPEYARPNSQLVGHYNPSGTKCQYCGHYDEHWHSKCATCKHYSGTDNPYR